MLLEVMCTPRNPLGLQCSTQKEFDNENWKLRKVTLEGISHLLCPEAVTALVQLEEMCGQLAFSVALGRPEAVKVSRRNHMKK